MFLEPARALIEKFESFCAHIVMNSELAIAPDASMLSVLPEPPASHALPYLNCGAFMGQARYIRLMLEGIKADIAANYEIDTQITSSEDWMTVNDQRCVSNTAALHAYVQHFFHPARAAMIDAGGSGGTS